MVIKCLIVSLVFSHLGFWSGNLFLIAPFPDLCLLVPFYKQSKTKEKDEVDIFKDRHVELEWAYLFELWTVLGHVDLSIEQHVLINWLRTLLEWKQKRGEA